MVISGGYQDLQVWQKACALAPLIYKLATKLPQSEIHALSNQMRRSAISVPSNIAEGWGRNATPDFIRFLRIARGSLAELETQIIIAVKLEYLTAEETDLAIDQIKEIGQMLVGMIRGLSQTTNYKQQTR